MNPIEGEHYIFNRYAFLKLAKDAPAEDIKKAITHLKAQNHPDRFAGTLGYDESIVKTAKRNCARAEECEAVLLDPDRRAAFDERLAWFEANQPKLISTNGNALIGNIPYVNLDQLLSGETPDHSFMASHMAELDVKDRTLLRAKRDYEENSNDPEAQAEYKELLLKRLAALTVKEGMAWETAGVTNMFESLPTAQLLGQYALEVDDEIEAVADTKIHGAIETKAAALLSGLAPPLLLTDQREEGENQPKPLAHLDELQISDISAKAREAFLSRTHSLKELAKQKQQLLHDIFALIPTEAITEGKGSGSTEIVLMVRKGDQEPRVGAAV